MKNERNTIQRQMVLTAVRALHNHPTAEDIYAHVAQAHPGISKATVYRNLALLAQQGHILRVSHLNAADRFDFQTHPHYHFRCTACNGVFDVEMDYDEHLLQRVRNPKGFLLQSYAITFSGLCPACRGLGATLS